MMKSHDAEASRSWKTLRAFLWSVETSEPRLPGYRCWKYLAGNNEPDFIWPEGKIAIELTGWIDEAEISKGKALEEFNRKIRTVLLKERETFKALEGHSVYLEALQPPKRNWDSVTRQMLIYLADRAATSRDLRLHLKNSELPQEMRAMLREAWIYTVPGSPSVRVVPKSDRSFLKQSFDAEKAAEQHLMRSVESFKKNLTKKMGKTEKYRSISKARGFDDLWLVIHYDDKADEWAAPWVPDLQFSYGSDSHESQRKLAQRIRSEVWSDRQRGHFGKVYLLFPDQPRPFAERLWP